MLMRTALDTAVARGAGTFSMLRGRETYKTTWQATEAPNRRLLLGRPGRLEVVAYAAALRTRSSLADAARTRAPAVREGLLKARTYARNPALARAEIAAKAPAVRDAAKACARDPRGAAAAIAGAARAKAPAVRDALRSAVGRLRRRDGTGG